MTAKGTPTMATPAAAPDTVTDDADRFRLLEIEGVTPEPVTVPEPAPAPRPTATPEQTVALTFQLAPDLLRGVRSLAELGAAMQSLAASLHALGVRQDDARREPLRAIARGVRAVFVWVAMWRSFSCAVAERPALVGPLVKPEVPPVTPAPVALVEAPAVEAAPVQPETGTLGTALRPHRAIWTKHGGERVARITGAAGTIAAGDRVRVTKRSGEEQDREVKLVVRTDGAGCALAEVGKITTTPATTRQPIPVVPESAQEPTTGAYAAPVTRTEQTGSIVEALGAAAQDARVGATSGSLAAGTMAGVGFTSAAGYVTALANGVKRGTADGYLATLRGSYKYTDEQIAALTVTIIPEAAPGSRPALAHEIRTIRPDVNAADMSPAERRALWRMTPGQLREAEAKKRANDEALTRLISLTAKGSGAIVSLGSARHGATATLAECEAAVTALGRKDLAPRAKSAKAQFGDIMGRFSRGGFKAWAAKRSQSNDWPAEVVSRWIVGELNGDAVLGSLGDKQIVAELLRSGEIRFTGGNAEQRERVQTEYTTRRAEQTLDATDLRDWIVTTIEREWHATTWAGDFFIPGDEQSIAPLRAFVEGIAALAGRGIEIAYMQSAKSLAGGIARGQLGDVHRIDRDVDTAEDNARKQARGKAVKEGADPMLAEKRATISADVAATLHKKCDELAVKIDGYALLVGDEIKPVKAALDKVRARLPEVDAGAMRAAMLELD